LPIVRPCGGTVDADFDDKRVDFIPNPLGHRVSDRMAVGLDPNHESEATGMTRDIEKARVGERLPTAQREIEDPELGQVVEELTVLVERELLSDTR
jgi:hypothetical protein